MVKDQSIDTPTNIWNESKKVIQIPVGTFPFRDDIDSTERSFLTVTMNDGSVKQIPVIFD